MNAVRYLWRHPLGRLAFLMIVVGVIGLATHYWAPFLLVGAIRPSPTQHYARSRRLRRSRHSDPYFRSIG